MKSTLLAPHPRTRARIALRHRLTGAGAMALLALALGPASNVVQAQPGHTTRVPIAPAAVMTKGIVRSVDAKAGTITIKHEHIVNIDMAPMTMVFKAAQPALLDGVKKDDQIRFHAEEPGGVLTVTAIEVIRSK